MTSGRWQGFPLRDAVIYELHVGTFTPEGTFAAVASRLDHLVALGINAIELMPVARFPGDRGWGYDVLDLRSVHPVYGTVDELKTLIDSAHDRGLAVICDVVYNHVGPGADVARDFGPHHTTTRYSTPWGPAINLDGPHSDEARTLILDNVRMWLEDFGFDGLRLDAIDWLVDTSAVHILEEIGAQFRALEERLGRTLWAIAESDLNDPRILWSKERGGYGMDAQWSDDFHHSLHALLTGDRFGYYVDFGRVGQVAKALQRAFVFDGEYSKFRRRKHGRPADGLSGHRFLGYLQNHDQVGNRTHGERSAVLLSPEMSKVAAALVFCSPFVPMLFMGEEWGASTPFLYFTDHADPELARAVREGRPGGELAPDPQNPATFEASKLRWEELDDPRHADLLEWHRRLIRLRRELPDLGDGRMERVHTRHSEEPPSLVVERGPVTIACNFAAVSVEVPVRSTGAELLLTSSKDPEPRGDQLRIPPESVAILQDLPSHHTHARTQDAR